MKLFSVFVIATILAESGCGRVSKPAEQKLSAGGEELQGLAYISDSPGPGELQLLLSLKTRYEGLDVDDGARRDLRLTILHTANRYRRVDNPPELGAFIIGLRYEQKMYLERLDESTRQPTSSQ